MKRHRIASLAALIAVGLIAMLGLVLTSATAEAHLAAVYPVADTPTPTLGSTPNTGANPPGTADGDPSDWSGMKWLPLGLLIPVLFIAGVWLAKRRDRRRDDSSSSPPSPRVN